MTLKAYTYFLLIIIGCSPSHATLAAETKVVSPDGHEAIKAEAIDKNPKNFTIDVWSLSNWDVNDEAPTFALYTSSKAPKLCADFTNLKIKYERPKEYWRKFDLSKHKEVITALEKTQCIIIKNIPSM